jgi:hypothetical protein
MKQPARRKQHLKSGKHETPNLIGGLIKRYVNWSAPIPKNASAGFQLGAEFGHYAREMWETTAPLHRRTRALYHKRLGKGLAETACLPPGDAEQFFRGYIYGLSYRPRPCGDELTDALSRIIANHQADILGCRRQSERIKLIMDFLPASTKVAWRGNPQLERAMFRRIEKYLERLAKSDVHPPG